jgi:hypothetical protein
MHLRHLGRVTSYCFISMMTLNLNKAVKGESLRIPAALTRVPINNAPSLGVNVGGVCLKAGRS